ncbi:MAG: non-heme iron oxygenase ferredoxin subunit [Deltaproteobacteria bacterium]|nr:non-heme iron oxygenase ferredoxin subunit [Deltaproteobacteria bacterium]
MAGFVKVAKADEIVPGQGKMVEVNGKKIALFNVEGAFYAIDDTCTHRGGPLSEGVLDGKEVTCPWHGATFDVTTGEVLGPPAPKGVSQYNVRLEGDNIEVEI